MPHPGRNHRYYIEGLDDRVEVLPSIRRDLGRLLKRDESSKTSLLIEMIVHMM